MNTEFESSLDVYIKAALGRKAFDMAILDVRELTSVADVFPSYHFPLMEIINN